MLTGCSRTDEPGYPPSDASFIAKNPLRRLSNGEYQNALHDLFPSAEVALPSLPQDGVVAGFENAIEAQVPSDVRIARYEEIANRYSEALTLDPTHISELTLCTEWRTPTASTECAEHFVTQMGQKIFRRPLTSDEQNRFLAHFNAVATSIDFAAAVQTTLSTMLQSPQFLYRAEPAPTSPDDGWSAVEPYAMASRLSFFLWQSIPDETLLAAAARDELQTPQQITAQTNRMLDDARSKRALWGFVRQWLGLDRMMSPEHAIRAGEVDALWSAATQQAAAREMQLFVEHVLSEDGTLRDLFVSRRAWLNDEVARVYGVDAPNEPWSETALPSDERAGLLTRIAFLAGYAHIGGTSPPLRGNFIMTRLLCQPPVSPPPDADLSMPTADPSLGPQTNRMLFAARTRAPTCAACHIRLDGYGFGFENYSASGAFRLSEQGLPIDATGSIFGTDVDRMYVGAVQLSETLANSERIHACAARQWYRYAFGRAAEPGENSTVAALEREFVSGRGNVRGLLLAIVTSPNFRLQKGQR